MVIEKIRLENWLSHVDTTLTFEKTTSLRGENGSGKTSVESGFEMLLTGRNVQTDDKGAGSRDLIRRGAEKAVITAILKDGERHIHMRCSITEKSGRTVAIKDPSDETWTGGDYLTSLAAKREILDCLINGRYFLDMDDARRKKLLAGILLPEVCEFEEWVRPALVECGIQTNSALRAFDQITLTHDNAYDVRKLINRLIKDWKEPEPVPPTVDLAVIRARLAERQTSRTDLAVKKGKIVGKFEDDKKARERASGKAGELQGKLTTEVKRRAQAAQGELSKARLQEAEKTAGKAEEGKKLEEEIARLNGEMTASKRHLASLQDLGEASECPTCHQPITVEAFTAVCAPAQEQHKKLAKAYQKALDDSKACGDYAAAQKLVDTHNQAVKDLALIDSRIKDLEGEIHEATQANATPPASQPDTTEIDAQIADLDSRIEKGSAALADAIRGEEIKLAWDRAQEAKKKLDAKQALLEKLVDYFGPKGIQAKLLDEHVGGFQESMNKVLVGWNFRCELQFDPFSFRAGLAGSAECFSLRTMSAGQRAMFAAAFQVALAKVSGFNFAWVDDAEVFSNENRVTLFKNLVAADLEQAIVMAADVRREIPRDENKQPRPGTAFYLFTLDRSGAVPTTVVERLT
jgi:hypothetical protein